MPGLDFLLRCLIVLLFSWLSVRIVGKKSISQMTSYDVTALFVLANVASEPLVYKVTTKALLGTLFIASVVALIGKMALSKRFYNFDSKPDIVIVNGKIDKEALSKNRINLPFLFSMMRLQGYANVSDVEFAIFEPNGNLSVIGKSQARPVTPKDLKLDTKYEGLALPLIIDGRIIEENLRHIKLSKEWLYQEIKKAGATKVEEIFLGELNSAGELYVDFYIDKVESKPKVI